MLAKKYRPILLDEVIGQDHIKRMLRNTFSDSGQVFNVYLFSGVYGSGKTTLARIFARMLICKELDRGDPNPCCVCEECLSFDQSENPNYLEYDAASYGQVDDVRRLVTSSSAKAMGSARYRVVVMDEAHQITVAGQNAFLKLLEEGSPTTVYFLVTTKPDKILETVRSRCVEFSLRPVAVEDVVSRLKSVSDQEGIQYEEAALTLISRAREGHIRDCLMLLEQMHLYGGVTLDRVREYLHYDKDELAFRVFISLLEDLGECWGSVREYARLAPVSHLWAALKRLVAGVYETRLGLSFKMSAIDEEWQKRIDELCGDRLDYCVGWLYGRKLVDETPEGVMVLLCLMKREVFGVQPAVSLSQAKVRAESLRSSVGTRGRDRTPNAEVLPSRKEITIDQFILILRGKA